MPEEAKAPVDYRALCNAEGWPPIRGGAPEGDEETADEASEATSQDEGLLAEPEPKVSDEPTVDYEKRFNDLQPQLTKAQEQNAEFQRTLQAARQGDPEAMDALGIPYEKPEDDEFLDPEEQLRQEVAQLKEQFGTQQQQAEYAGFEEQEASYIAEQIDALEKEAGIELDDQAIDFVIDRARSNRGEDGAPDIQGAFKGFNSIIESDRKRYLESKKNAPKVPVGGPGEDKIDLSDTEQRQAAMVRDMEAEMSE